MKVVYNIRIVVVLKKCWRVYATPAIRKQFENLCLQSLALPKLSSRDFPLWYDSKGGSWKFLLGAVDFE